MGDTEHDALYLRVRCPKCGNEVKQPRSWADKPFDLLCRCGWSLHVDLPDLHESARAIKEGAKLFAEPSEGPREFDQAGFAEYLDANPDQMRKLLERLAKLRRD